MVRYLLYTIGKSLAGDTKELMAGKVHSDRMSRIIFRHPLCMTDP